MPEETPPLLVISKLPPFFGSFFQFENPQFSAEKPPKIFTAELFYYKILQYEIPILKIVPKQNEPSKKYFFLNPDAKKKHNYLIQNPVSTCSLYKLHLAFFRENEFFFRF